MKLKILFIAFVFATIASCSKTENLDIEPPPNLGGETVVPTAIDQWLSDSLAIPYNISVKYRWDPFELNLDKTLTPPDENKIIQAMSAIKRVWIDPYNEETGSDVFIKKYSPKQFKLVGSVEYNYNGTVVLGQAEGGNNIIFFDINQNFDQDPVSSVKRMIHTSHHEFAHVLHQTILYPQEFKGISARLGMDGYTGTWFNISEEEALANGYITAYSMASYDEDFVEMVSGMLVEGKPLFDEIVASQNPTAQEALRQKEKFVVNYFRDVWNIDFYSLQTRVQNALNNLVPTTPVNDVFGPDEKFTTASVNPTDVSTPHSAPFKSMFNKAADSVAALPGGNTLDSLQLFSLNDTTTLLLFYMTQADTLKVGVFGLDDTELSNGNHRYSIYGTNDIGLEIEDAVVDVLLYFHNRQFKLSWYADPNITLYPKVKFAPISTPNNYFIGRLLP